MNSRDEEFEGSEKHFVLLFEAVTLVQNGKMPWEWRTWKPRNGSEGLQNFHLHESVQIV